MLSPVTFDNFSLGVADRYVDTDVRRAACLDNLVIDEVNKLYVRDGSYIYDAYLPYSANQRRPTGLYIGPMPFNRPLTVVGQRAYQVNSSSGWTEIQGPEGNAFLPTKTDTDYESSLIWRRQLISCADVTGLPPTLIYCPEDSPFAMEALTLGLPAMSPSPVTAASGSDWSGIYFFFYQYSYTDYLGTEFIFRSNPILMEVTNATGDPAANNIDFTAIPELVNTALTNYDVDNVTIEIYRTVNGGQTGFFVDSISNGDTTYTDTASDDSIQDNEVIYTAGGVLGYDQPPLAAKGVTQTYDFFWYITDTAMYQSVSGNPGACPAELADDLDQKAIAIDSIQSYPVVFCDRSVYRIEGTFDDFGNNGYQRREIHPHAGCIGPASVVKTPAGLFWFGNGGVYWTDGFKVTKISHHLDLSYGVWANERAKGGYDPVGNTISWTVSSSPSQGAGNDLFLVLDLNQAITEESVFYTKSSLGNIYPTALAFSSSSDIYDAGSPFRAFYNKQLFTDARGYLLYFDPLSLTDPLIDTSLLPTEMGKKAIVYNYTTAGLNQGSSSVRKYTPEVSVEVEGVTEFAMQIRHRRDDGGSWSGTGGHPTVGTAGSPGGAGGNPGVPEIRQDGPITWMITDCAWLNDGIEHPWLSIPSYTGKRTVPYGQLRSERRQLCFTNAFTIIQNSDDTEDATIDVSSTYPTVTLATETWVDDAEGYYITFEDDEYVQTFEIRSRVSDSVIEVYDPLGVLANGTQSWEIKGFRKHERPRLMSFTLYSEGDGETFNPSTAQEGANA